MTERKTKQICITIDQEVHRRAKEVLAEMGLQISTGIELFLRAVIREQRIPFSVNMMPSEHGSNEERMNDNG